MNIDIYIIWAIGRSEPGAPFAVDAWDEFAIDENERGWREALAKAAAENDEIRIVKTTLNHGALVKLFQPATLRNGGIIEVSA